MSKAKALFVLAAVVVCLPLTVTWRGYVLSVMWGWFAVPAFGAPAASIPVCIGISSMIAMITYQYDSRDDEAKRGKIAEAFMFSFGLPAMALLVGWIAKGFMS